ncbi:MAG: DUF4105 domain-containing protein [Bacteroidaceae bacterium]
MRASIRIIAFLAALWLQFPLNAREVPVGRDISSVEEMLGQDSVQVSLLTCSPGQEVYSLYGHTAIRCVDFTKGMDVVFNYGVFSFSQPHFIWRFVLGQCDYMVEAVGFNGFLRSYRERGSRVTEQILSLNREEARAVLAYLIWNCRRENCEYRYNFLYNNCTTMVRDVIERNVHGRVVYPIRIPPRTTREILHEYTQGYPWAAEGDDFLLGSAVDTVASDRAAMFAPEYMMWYADGASIIGEDGQKRPLVTETCVLVPGRDVPCDEGFPLSPVQLGWGLFVLCVLVVVVELVSGRLFTLWSLSLLSLQGLAGLLLLFMFLFSEHPAVDSNWLIWPFTPFALLGLYFSVCDCCRWRVRWWSAYFCFLASFLLFYPIIPQVFGNIVVPLTMCLLTRPIGFYLFCRRNR